jgi:mediator of RNA polymerase II transcription subunit 5
MAPGDPQSAVGNLGDVVLFAQLAITRFKVIRVFSEILGLFNTIQISDTLKHKNRPLDISYLRRADAIPVLSAPTAEAKAFKTWSKALFDKNSEGIEDGVLR